MRGDLIELAPREVHDLVYECCRVLGLDGGVAGDVARSVTTIEICFGQGLAAFDQEVSRLGQQGGSLLASPFVRAPDQWRAGELRLVSGQTGAVHFEPATPLAALGSVLNESLERGVGWATLGVGGGEATDLTGIDRLEEVELDILGPDHSVPDRWRRRRTDALRHGLKLPQDLIGRLTRLAATFLVSEAAVDAALGLTESGTENGPKSGTEGGQRRATDGRG